MIINSKTNVMRNTGLFIGGLLLGAAIGGALGVLYAPRSGKETRDKLGNKLHDLENELNKLRAKAKEKGIELKDEIKNKIADIEGKIEKMVNDHKKKAETV
jgi:gas vesicle protein